MGKVENIVGKGENACYQHVLLSPCFQKASSSSSLRLTLLTSLKKKPFENTVGKGGNAENQHFLFLSQCFLPIQEKTLSSEID